ncbi:acyl-CoA dehydrogenase family protein [Microbacterium sp. LWH10-1.2]|uniref:acyl-CoA dehydrogenase family protein n=1 Tax=Microbacterium sp. LWH10-1.2 TaxID=3135255 RepID=UPI00313871BA
MFDTLVRPSITEIIDQLTMLRPELAEGGREGDLSRRVPERVFKAVQATGAFNVSAPEKFGGLAANTRDVQAVTSAIGAGDGSLAWMAGIYNTGAWVLSLMSDQAQEDVWGERGKVGALVSIVLATTSEAVAVDGGYRITGRWTYGTGSREADWSLLGIPLKNGTGEIIDAGVALIPRENLTFEDDWFVAGMKSTASVTQLATDVFVPSHRIFRLTAAIEGEYIGSNRGTSYRTMFVPSLFMNLVGPHLGMGRAALDFVVAAAGTKSIAFTGYDRQADSTIFQYTLAKSAVQLAAAEALAEQVADEIYLTAERGDYAPYADRIALRAKAGWIIDTITQLIGDLVTAHGSAGFADSSTLQRIWRDQAAAARHGHTLSASGYEALGRVIVGRESDARFVLPVV